VKHEILTRQALRIFLASPGDVADERSLARDLIALLPYDPLLAGKITLEVVAWDSPGVGVPMLATMNPQQAIREGLPRPSQCDIVVVIFWARIGSPIDPGWEPGRKPDGQLYRSGTEWEYLEALQAAEKSGHPDILVYRRTGAPTPRLDDPNLDEILEQWKGVQAFFSEFRNKDGSNKRSYHSYNSPTDFKEKLTLALRALIKKRLDTAPVHPIGKSSRGKVCPSWKDPPYPGLRPFKFEEAPIFVGRSKETDALVEMLSDHTRSFLAVVGASGSGKSSLVTAGLFPRLHSGAIEGSGDWHCVTFTPGRSTGGPVSAMAQAFTTAFPAKGWTAGALEIRLLERGAIGELTAAALDNAPAWAKIVLFVDQLEELFTVVAQEQIDPFLDLLTRAAAAPRVRVIVTLRADFYPVTLKSAQRGAVWLALAGPGVFVIDDHRTRRARRRCAGARTDWSHPFRNG